MKYIIMADGKGTRWNNYKDIPKHLIQMDGETLLNRIVRLLKKFDSHGEVIITSRDPRYEVLGARRHQPENNVLEIDRFTSELIEDNVCFLYGDTYYSESAIHTIVTTKVDNLMFFGNERSIVAVKITNGQIFRHHVERVRELFLKEKIENCKGWQVYQSYQNLPFDEKRMAEQYIYIEDETRDFNSPEDYENGKDF